MSSVSNSVEQCQQCQQFQQLWRGATSISDGIFNLRRISTLEKMFRKSLLTLCCSLRDPETDGLHRNYCNYCS